MPTAAEHKKRLLAFKAQLLAAGDETIEAPVDDIPTARPDEDAQPLAEMNQVIASSRNRNRTEILARVVAAMERLAADPDEYGNCTECGEPIAERRLAVMPYAELCVECQGAKDGNDGPKGPTGRRHLRDFR